MNIVCCDLEGVFVPEIWINVAERTGIEELRLTTRDISDYDVLMGKRLDIMADNNLKIQDIQSAIAAMDPLPGALDFLNWMRTRTQVIILSDTFTQFAGPLMEKLGWPTLFCNDLTIAPDGTVTGYNLRQYDGKRKAVIALKSLDYRVIAMGDSYNDITMLQEADDGILFCPPENVKAEYPDFSVCEDYPSIQTLLEKKLA